MMILIMRVLFRSLTIWRSTPSSITSCFNIYMLTSILLLMRKHDSTLPKVALFALQLRVNRTNIPGDTVSDNVEVD